MTAVPAAALVLVLSFALLRARGLARTLPLSRWHTVATALAALATVIGSPTHALIARLLGAAVLAGLAWFAGRTLERLEGRTGVRQSRHSSLPLIGLGLVLTSLAVLTVAAGPPGAPAQRETTALGMAVTLVGLLAVSRPASPALCLARVVALGDGLVLLACVGPPSAMLAALLAPASLLAAAITIGRAGGLPVANEDWR